MPVRPWTTPIRAAMLTALLLACLAAPARADAPPGAPPSAPVIPCRVLAAMPHDADAFTQGLVWSRGLLLESVGGYGVSDVRRVDPATGEVLGSWKLPASQFGEGLALAETPAGPRLVQLTWRAGLARFLDPDSLEPVGEARYQGEGWGLAWDGQQLIMSDGSAQLVWRSPTDFRARRAVVVTDGGNPVSMLNELEWAADLDPAGPVILANVLGRDRIAAVDPESGRVRFWIDCSALHPLTRRRSPNNVLNGMAWDPGTRRLFVTGKRWPTMFVIEIDPPR